MNNLHVFFQIDGDWIEAVDDGGVYTRDGITITRGNSDEADKLQPSTATFTLKNTDLRYSDSPVSPYYGKFGQGTPVRVLSGVGGFGLMADVSGAAETPDSPAISITGDVDVRMENLSTENATVIHVGGWLLSKSGSDFLNFQWAVSGVTHTEFSTAAVPNGHRAYRATLDVNNGAGGHTVNFYTAESWGDPWIQLGSSVVLAGVTSIDNGTGALRVRPSGTLATGCVSRVEVRSGINGTTVASPDFSAQSEGTTSFNDAQGNVWTLTGDAVIGYTVSSYRFFGEVSELKDQRSSSGNDVYVKVEASGISRRLAQGGGSPVPTALESYVPNRTGSTFQAVGYWPLNEGVGSNSGKALVGSSPMVLTRSNSPNSRFGRGDLGLPWLDKGISLYEGDVLKGQVSHTPTGGQDGWEFNFVYASEDGADMVVNLYARVGGIHYAWDIQLLPSSGFLGIVDPFGGQTLTSVANWDFDPFDGTGKLVTVRFYQSGTDVDVNFVISTNYEGEGFFGTNDIIDDGFSTTWTDPIGPASVGMLEFFDFEHIGDPDKEFALGHVSVLATTGLSNIYAIEVPAAGMINETATARMDRVCSDKGITMGLAPNSTRSFMGPQKPNDFLAILEECVSVERGFLLEARDFLGYEYRPLSLRQNYPTVELTLDYATQQIAYPFDPQRDDLKLKNDVTTKREDGGSGRFEQTVGRFKVSDPADGGVGRYTSSVTVNPARDGMLTDLAGWIVHVDTWDEPRFPTVTVNLNSPEIEDLLPDIMGVDVGDRINIVNLESLGYYDDLKLIVVGYEESYDSGIGIITFNCVPFRPYEVVELNSSTEGQLDSLGSTLSAGINTTATSVSVAVSDAGLWQTGSVSIPIKVGGEAMTVTNISGASSPQTFTVTRSVNGVVKSHSAGAQVVLARPATLAYLR